MGKAELIHGKSGPGSQASSQGQRLESRLQELRFYARCKPEVCSVLWSPKKAGSSLGRAPIRTSAEKFMGDTQTSSARFPEGA